MSDRSIPPCFYRISSKALIFNETRDKFIITKDVKVDPDGMWDVPGGGLEWGEGPQAGLAREITEEMSLETTWIADHPAYFVTHTSAMNPSMWICNVLYETTIANLDFTPTDECTAIDWVGKDNAEQFQLFEIVAKLVEQFDPAQHQR